MRILETSISGCYEIKSDAFLDDRGSFFKIFNSDTYAHLGLETQWEEEYFSNSKKNVIRGMHFQIPPKDHSKIVTCLSGSVIDVIVDLRKNSPTYKKHIIFKLKANSDSKMIYIPTGCAHGFLSLENDTLLYYKVSSVYSSENDKGILWNSFDFDWGIEKPIISERDSLLPTLSAFKSPFVK